MLPNRSTFIVLAAVLFCVLATFYLTSYTSNPRGDFPDYERHLSSMAKAREKGRFVLMNFTEEQKTMSETISEKEKTTIEITHGLPDLPVTYILMYPFSFLIPALSPHLIIEIFLAVFTSLIAIPIYFLAKNITGDEMLGLTSSILAVFSVFGGRMYFYGTAKNIVGNIFAVSSLVFLYLVWKKGFTWKHYILFLSFFTLTLLTHTLSFAFLTIVTTIFLLLKLFRNPKNRFKILYFSMPMIIMLTGLFLVVLTTSNYYHYTNSFWTYRKMGTPIEAKNLYRFLMEFRVSGRFGFMYALSAFVFIWSLFVFRKTKSCANTFLSTLSLSGLILYSLDAVWMGHLTARFLEQTYVPFSLSFVGALQKCKDCGILYLIGIFSVFNYLMYMVHWSINL